MFIFLYCDVIFGLTCILCVMCVFIHSWVHLELLEPVLCQVPHTHMCTRTRSTPAHFFHHIVFNLIVLSVDSHQAFLSDNQYWNKSKINFPLYCNILEFVVILRTCCPHLINEKMLAEVTELFIGSITNSVLMVQHFLINSSCHLKKASSW